MYFIISQEDAKKLKKISLLLIYALFTYWLLLNGQALFDEWGTGWTTSILFYIVGVSLFLDISDKIPDELKTPLIDNVNHFLYSFVACSGLFIFLHAMGWWFQNTPSLPTRMILPTLIFQGLIVSLSEEIIFRGVIFRYLYSIKIKHHVAVSYVGSSVIFAVFHFAAYGGSVAFLSVAFAIGLLLAYATDHFSLGAAWGLHFSYNAASLGIIFVIQGV